MYKKTILRDLLLDISENNVVKTLRIISNAAKSFDILATSLSTLHNYFDNSIKLLF